MGVMGDAKCVEKKKNQKVRDFLLQSFAICNLGCIKNQAPKSISSL